MALTLARSLAGHDKDEIYVIIGEAEGLAILANGRNRTLDNPKKKKYKHLQLIRSLPEDLMGEKTEGMTDVDIKRILKAYSKGVLNVEN